MKQSNDKAHKTNLPELIKYTHTEYFNPDQ